MTKQQRNLALNHSQALKLIQQTAAQVQLAKKTVHIDQASGYITASDIVAPINVPAHACSRMDGYAINLATLAQQSQLNHNANEYRLELGPAIHAQAQTSESECGELAIPIMTGGVLPTDADAVVLKEHARIDEGVVYFDELPKKHEYTRAVGSDMQQGQVVMQANQSLNAASLGLIASLGIDQIEVWHQPKVALMMTGDELVPPGKTCLPGQIHDSNSVMLAQLLTGMGCDVTVLPTLVDTEALVNERLQTLASEDHDLIITVGGVSMGDKDWIPHALENQGTVVFHKVRIKPGFPMLFGQLGGALFYGLPGNPVSGYTTACQYIFPAIQTMTYQVMQSPNWRATLTHEIKKSHLRREFMRGLYSADHTGQLQVTVCGGQQSSRIESLAQANCFIVLNESDHDLLAGSQVVIQPFSNYHSAI